MRISDWSSDVCSSDLYAPDGSWFGLWVADRTRSPSAQRLWIRRGCRGRSPDLRADAWAPRTGMRLGSRRSGLRPRRLLIRTLVRGSHAFAMVATALDTTRVATSKRRPYSGGIGRRRAHKNQIDSVVGQAGTTCSEALGLRVAAMRGGGWG